LVSPECTAETTSARAVPRAQTTEEEWHSTVDGSLTATFFTVKSFLPGMIERGSSGRLPTGAPAPYAAAKAGVIMLTRHVANEVGGHGVRVNCLAPHTVLGEIHEPATLVVPCKQADSGRSLCRGAGFVTQIVSGVDVPTVQPSLVILLVAAGLVGLLPWRWMPVAGAAVGLFLLVGFFASGAVGSLLEPSELGVFVGAWVQFLAVIVAFVAGIAATIQNYRSRS